MLTLGLTGMVGCGKSTVLKILAENGAVTLEADKVGHQLLTEKSVIQEVVNLLGTEVLMLNGQLDRTQIGNRVFADPDLLHRYNQILHPRLLEGIRQWLDERKTKGELAVVEAALIPEWGIEDWFDEVWYVSCSEEAALGRWNQNRKKFFEIRAAQFAPERKRAKAERVIDNEKSQEELRRRVEAEWERFRRTGNSRSR